MSDWPKTLTVSGSSFVKLLSNIIKMKGWIEQTGNELEGCIVVSVPVDTCEDAVYDMQDIFSYTLLEDGVKLTFLEVGGEKVFDDFGFSRN